MNGPLAIVTAVHTVTPNLLVLFDSLQRQTSKNFIWIIQVKDSPENRDHEILRLIVKSDIQVAIELSEDDGVYDALNRAIRRCRLAFYLVAGDDDSFSPRVVEHYDLFDLDGVDILSFAFEHGAVGVVRPFVGSFLFKGPYSIIAGHSTSAVIRRSLHDEIGFYDTSYRIAADYKFFLECIKLKKVIVGNNYVAGKFGAQGMSSRLIARSGAEAFRARQEVIGASPLDHLIYFLRVSKWKMSKLFR